MKWGLNQAIINISINANLRTWIPGSTGLTGALAASVIVRSLWGPCRPARGPIGATCRFIIRPFWAHIRTWGGIKDINSGLLWRKGNDAAHGVSRGKNTENKHICMIKWPIQSQWAQERKTQACAVVCLAVDGTGIFSSSVCVSVCVLSLTA